jgi:hypothetical protein
MKLESVLEEARNDAAVVAPGAARERVWHNLQRPRRARPTLLYFAASAALGAVLCLGIVRLVQPAPQLQLAKVELGQATFLTLRAPARVELGTRRIELQEGTATLKVAADGSGMLEVQSGACFLTDSDGSRRPVTSGTTQLGPLLSEEVALYERGWAQLSKNPQAALAVFDDQLRRFPKGALVQEARLSRLEALVALGRHAEAVQEARSFLQDFPQSERAAEVKKILEEK